MVLDEMRDEFRRDAEGAVFRIVAARRCFGPFRALANGHETIVTPQRRAEQAKLGNR
jgi:hypothetical protein